jgi:hypothetical protein
MRTRRSHTPPSHTHALTPPLHSARHSLKKAWCRRSGKYAWSIATVVLNTAMATLLGDRDRPFKSKM